VNDLNSEARALQEVRGRCGLVRHSCSSTLCFWPQCRRQRVAEHCLLQFTDKSCIPSDAVLRGGVAESSKTARNMASVPFDPLKALSAALAAPADSKEQADALGSLREHLEAHPSPIPVICTTLISTLSNAGDSVLRRWVLDLLHFAICRANLSVDARTQRMLYASCYLWTSDNASTC
jgi:hypothetical protein